MNNNVINVNNISPQLIQGLIDRIDVLEKLIYDYDGKGVRKETLNGDRIIAETVNGDRIIAKTVNGDRITGGVIEGALLKTINSETDKSGNYAFLQKQWLEVCLNGNKLMDIGIVDNDSGNPVIHFYHPNGNSYFTIWGSNSDNFVTIGGFNTEIKGEGHWNFDNIRVNGDTAATQQWVKDYVTANVSSTP